MAETSQQEGQKQQIDEMDIGIIDKQEERQAAASIFRSGLLDFFQAEEEGTLEVIKDYNRVLIVLLAQTKGLKKELENALYENQEKLTGQAFELEGHKKEPTIGNWLRYFIKQHGSGSFDNVELSKFVTGSKNGQRLNESERLLVQKLLRLYRNIKFFPEQLKGQDPEKWEIIPIEDMNASQKARQVSGPPKTEEERDIEELEKQEKEYQEGSLERMALDEEIKRKKDLEELKIEAKKHEEGSLERQALEEEIKRLENK